MQRTGSCHPTDFLCAISHSRDVESLAKGEALPLESLGSVEPLMIAASLSPIAPTHLSFYLFFRHLLA